MHDLAAPIRFADPVHVSVGPLTLTGDLTVPADAGECGRLAPRYTNPALGDIAVTHTSTGTVFDFGEWKSEMASRKNPDGTISFSTISPGVQGFTFVIGSGAKKTLTLRDAQHEYVLEEVQ